MSFFAMRTQRYQVILLIFVAVLAVFAMIAWAGIYFSTPSSGGQAFVVNDGENNDRVVERLKTEDVIRSTTIFNWILNYSAHDAQFQPGIYDLTGAASYSDIIARLVSGGRLSGGLVAEEMGVESLVNVFEEPIGAHCPDGGNRVDSGIDSNNNGFLDPGEVRLTNYVCHGAAGEMDILGMLGVKSLVKLSAEPVGAHCAYKGHRVDIGVDLNNNGALDTAEITATSYVCNGATGATGTTGTTGATGAEGETGTTGAEGETGRTGAEGETGATGSKGETGTTGSEGETGTTGSKGETGATGAEGTTGTTGATGAEGETGTTGAEGATSLVSISDEPEGTNCAYAGKKMESGLDTNNNGVLDAAEVTTTSYVCNGIAGTEGATSLVIISDEPEGADCPHAGKKMESGLDTNNNGVLDAAEVTATSYVCNGATGATGETGATGATGPAGSSGSTLVTGATVISASGATKNTQVTATATCPAGKVLLGGGAQVTTTDVKKERAVLVSSRPSSTTSWIAVGMVADSNLGGSETLSVTAYALCSL